MKKIHLFACEVVIIMLFTETEQKFGSRYFVVKNLMENTIFNCNGYGYIGTIKKIKINDSTYFFSLKVIFL